MNPAHNKSGGNSPDYYYRARNQPAFAGGIRNFQFFSPFLGFLSGGQPYIPAIEAVADVVELLEEIGIQAHLVEKHREKRKRYYPKRPRPDDFAGNQQDIDGD